MCPGRLRRQRNPYAAVSVMPGWLRCNCLAYAQYLFGSVFWLICFELGEGRPAEKSAAPGFAALPPVFGDKYPATELNTLSVFKKKEDCPKLRGKGGQIRGLSPAVQKIWAHHADNNDVINCRTAQLCTCAMSLKKSSPRISSRRCTYSARSTCNASSITGRLERNATLD